MRLKPGNSRWAQLGQYLFYRSGTLTFHPSASLLRDIEPFKQIVVQELERKFGRKIEVQENRIEFRGGPLSDVSRSNFVSFIIKGGLEFAVQPPRLIVTYRLKHTMKLTQLFLLLVILVFMISAQWPFQIVLFFSAVIILVQGMFSFFIWSGFDTMLLRSFRRAEKKYQ